ncbi:hypothetical protein [Paenibacillus elgii]|uniref:Uncharacterized protein n=1 Tax=Paenibacillus elgii TaxID=189691 RepID=A0A161TKV0_9BACL|nr:hypothetical protein [Paenibacillus elgii]KZE76687.1 hypothetical protein AV654_03025 [Paenibacillus elgii]MCM3272320.1 hypothetical protein [Paenibacillus elgii]NEN85242.1 hypothetical protein [Paenibacillus elgii]
MIFAPMTVNLIELKINALDHAAVVNIGPNQHVDLYVSYKRNQGIGEQNGDLSPITATLSWIMDPDLIDAGAMKNSII